MVRPAVARETLIRAAALSSIGWYLKRLRVMSGPEVVHRLGQQASLSTLLLQYRLGVYTHAHRARDSANFSFCTASRPQLPPLKFDSEGVKRQASALVQGELEVFGRRWQWGPAADAWHRAPDTGRLWPKRFFASISFRERNPYGDVRQLWEISRLQHLVDLALVARLGPRGERQSAVRMISAQLRSWVEHNPPLTGVHYISAMECGLRLIALCHALDMTRELLEDDAPWQDLLTVVGFHAPFIERRISIHSSAGNHTIAEATALVYAGTLFREMRGSHRWLLRGLATLEEASTRQVLPDGGGIEQALHYHLGNVQLLTLATRLLDHHGLEAPATIRDATDRATRFLLGMGLARGCLPAIGDSDSGHALSQSLLLPEASFGADDPVTTFGDSGYTIARVSTTYPIIVTFDHGPLGMAPSFGHGHADALAVLLRAGGEDILIDTGTYTYTGDRCWRSYFRGTSAHNTVSVDGRDQATQEACFLWSNPYRARLLAADRIMAGGGRLLAQHDGYARLGVKHSRGVAWSTDEWLLVWDCLSGEGEHLVDLHWHLGKLPTWRGNQSFSVDGGGHPLVFTCLGGRVSAHRGQRDPIAGWRSPAYGRLGPITTMKVTSHGPLPLELNTIVRLDGSNGSDGAIDEVVRWMRQLVR